MQSLENYFDTYGLGARVKPAFLLVFPTVISIFVLYEPSRAWGNAALTIALFFGILTFASNQMSSKGNNIQDKLFMKWGGAATTIILRHSDHRLDRHTKDRYMDRLENLIPNFQKISREQELHSLIEADEMYKTASIFLRENTRDVKSYPLIFKENIAYGFSRNLYAFKYYGMAISILSLSASSLVVWFNHIKESSLEQLDLLFSIPFSYIGLELILISFTLMWIFMINEKWVERRAFAYARALLAACEESSELNKT